MSTIQATNTTAYEQFLTTSTPGTTESASSFQTLLSSIEETSQSFLKSTGRTQGVYDAAMPSTAQIMDLGVDWESACELIYGVVGSSDDYRDWNKIMASSDPLASLKQANAQMYGGKDSAGLLSGATGEDISIEKREGNFAIIGVKDVSEYKSVVIVDGEGNPIRHLAQMSDAYTLEMHEIERIEKNASYFGFDTSDLYKLISLEIPQDAPTQVSQPSTSELLGALNPTTTQTQESEEVIEESEEVVTTVDSIQNVTTSTTDSNLAALTNLYQSYLNREPDLEGLTYWTEKLNSGATLQEIENAFYLSEEFVSLSQGTTTTTPSSTASSITTALENATLEDLLKLV